MLLFRRSAGFRAARIVLVVVVLAIGWFLYMMHITFHPDSGPEGVMVRNVASVANKHLSNSPDVVSTEITEASADLGGSAVRLDARLKDGTSVETAADLIASMRQKTLDKEPDYGGDLIISVSWTLSTSTINVDVDCQRDPSAIRTDMLNALNTVGQAQSFTGTIGGFEGTTIDYGDVTTTPPSLPQPSSPDSTKTFTMNGWKVTATSNADGQFTNAPLDQVVAAARQTSTTGTIDLNTDTLSVTGLVTDDTKSLTPETAAPVVHAIGDCTTASLTTLQLNNWTQDGASSVRNPWLAFTCQNGTWTPKHEGSTGQDEAAILQRAAEL